MDEADKLLSKRAFFRIVPRLQKLDRFADFGNVVAQRHMLVLPLALAVGVVDLAKAKSPQPGQERGFAAEGLELGHRLGEGALDDLFGGDGIVIEPGKGHAVEARDLLGKELVVSVLVATEKALDQLSVFSVGALHKEFVGALTEINRENDQFVEKKFFRLISRVGDTDLLSTRNGSHQIPKRMNTMTKTARLLILLVFLTGHAGIASANTASANTASASGARAGNGEIGFSFGLAEAYDGDGTTSRFDFRGGYHFTDRYQIEGQVIDMDIDHASSDLTLSVLMINSVFNFRPPSHPKIVPYLLVGLGEAEVELLPEHHHYGHHYRPDVLSSSAALQLAAGSRFFVGNRVGFRVEGAILFEETFDQPNEHVSFSFGLTWRLGPKRTTSATGSPATP